MNILLIYSYPNHEGLNYAIRETVEKNLSDQHKVDIIDLYQENFNPLLTFDHEHRRRDLMNDQETQVYRDKIERADFIIFIFPIWWSSMPAILKGFIDRVFAKGFAYYYKGLFPVPMLKNKKAWIINTHDSPVLYANFIQKDYGRILSKQILKMCGISTYKHTSLSYIRASSQEKRQKFLDKIASISQKI
jgi:NAD(P)H dehydrogenase (quinone)